MNRRLLAVSMAVTFFALAGCVSARARLQERYSQGLRPLTPVGLEQAGLTRLWEKDISEVTEGKKVKIQIKDAYLYDTALLVITADNFVYSFDRQTGEPLWLAQLPQALKAEPAYFNTKFYCVCGTGLFIIDSHGAVAAGGTWHFSVSKPLLVTDDYIYAVGSDGRLHKVDKLRLNDIWKSPANTESVIADTPILLEGMFFFGTEQGEVFALDRVTGGRRVELRGLGPIAGRIVTDGQYLYFGSADYHLHCCTTVGGPVWKKPTEGVMILPPVLAGDTLYAEFLRDGLLAVAKKDGGFLWRNADAKAFVASDAARVFAIAGTDEARELWILDAATGQATAQVDVKEFALAPRNLTGDGLVFLVGKSGRIVCLRAK